MDDRVLARLWHESVTLVRSDRISGERGIIREGKLWEVLSYLDTVQSIDRGALTISLPDRRTPPFTIDAHRIRALLDRPDRPGFSSRRR